MDWKQIAINTLTALLVAVLSGVLVWFFTHEPKHREGVTYSLNNSGEFGSGKERLSIFTANITNRGSANASNMVVRISAPPNSNIRDFNAKYRTPKPEGINYKFSGRDFIIRIPRFLMQDRLQLSVLYKGPASGSPILSIRTDDGVGKRLVPSAKSPLDELRPAFLFTLFISFAALTLFSRYFAGNVVKRFNKEYNDKDQNNSGFFLLHSGLTKEALSVLELATRSGSTGPITLSNYATAKALSEQRSDAENLIEVAHKWAMDSRTQAIVLFNEFICKKHWNDSDYLTALEKAISLNDVIKTYCTRSALVQKIVAEDSDVAALL